MEILLKNKIRLSCNRYVTLIMNVFGFHNLTISFSIHLISLSILFTTKVSEYVYILLKYLSMSGYVYLNLNSTNINFYLYQSCTCLHSIKVIKYVELCLPLLLLM